MSFLSRPIRFSLWAFGLVLLNSCLGTTTAIADEGRGNTAGGVTFGIEGHYRVGCWTGLRTNHPITAIETRDGDGVQVEYGQPSKVEPHQWAYAIPGTEAAPVRLKDAGTLVDSTRFPTLGSPSRGPAMIPLEMSWIVAFGDPLGVEQIGANALLNRDPLIAVSMPEAASGFPDSILGYDGVDMMLIGGSSIDRLRALNSKQTQAIADWITNGGRVFLTLGESAPELFDAAPWLQALLPMDEIATTKINPSAVETFTSSQTPLETYVGAKLPKDKGRVLILGRTSRRVSTPIASEYIVGFGRVTVVAADLEDAPFDSWPERLDLIRELTGSILIPGDREQVQRNRATAYADLAGQLRTTLDQFAIKRPFGFSLVSLILMALIAAIGPLDYLLVNRFLGRPLLGWISFPVTAIGLSALLTVQARPQADPSANSAAGAGPQSQRELGVALQCNRIEIFDIDSLQNIGRGFVASYLYRHEAFRFDLKVEQSDSLRSISAETQRMLTFPFGYPGESFGGIQIDVEDARLPVYQVPINQAGSDEKAVLRASLAGLPLASRSSKGIATRCWFTPNLGSEVALKRRPGSELLQGELVNPLPLDLLDGMLVYRNWAYLLPTRFPSGDRIPDVTSLRQKNFRWRLSRQMALESATETEAWDPMMSDSPGRVAEMLMFHNAVGGSRYTGLRDDPLSFLDLSHVLTSDRCILVGRLAKPVTNIEANDDSSTQQPSGETLTLMRVILPVIDR